MCKCQVLFNTGEYCTVPLLNNTDIARHPQYKDKMHVKTYDIYLSAPLWMLILCHCIAMRTITLSTVYLRLFSA